MRIVYLLLHDFRFASIGVRDFALRGFHFSKEYARRMALMGHDVKLYVLGSDVAGLTTFQMDGYELKAFRPSFRFPPFWGFGNDHSLDVLRELSRDSPDMVHFHNYYLWSFPYVALWVRRGGSPLLAQFHGTDPVRTLKGFGFYPSLRLCSRILVPTSEERRFLTQTLRIPGGHVDLVPGTGVDTNRFRRAETPTDEMTLLYVGRIPAPSSYMWEKSPAYLLPIIAHLRGLGINPRLLVAGDGPGEAAMKASAASLGIQDSVEFLGPIRNEKLPDLYSRSRLTFVPIHMDDIEPYWGGTVQESLACGTPVVAFNATNPGPKDFGLLIPPNSNGADMVADALRQGQQLREAGERGRAFVLRNCSWESVASRLNDIYEGFAPRTSGAGRS